VEGPALEAVLSDALMQLQEHAADLRSHVAAEDAPAGGLTGDRWRPRVTATVIRFPLVPLVNAARKDSGESDFAMFDVARELIALGRDEREDPAHDRGGRLAVLSSRPIANFCELGQSSAWRLRQSAGRANSRTTP
jgi:hypothetical protein